MLRPSWWFLMSSLVSPAALALLGGWGLLSVGRVAILPLVLLVVGAVLWLIVLVDLPVRSDLSTDGVVRRCLLRRHRLPWDDVVAVGRTRVDRGTQRLVGRAVAGERSRSGGLVLEVGPKRRRYLLTDRAERPDEHDELRRLVPVWAPGVSLPTPPK